MGPMTDREKAEADVRRWPKDAAAEIAALRARLTATEAALVWCADAPMTATLEALGEDPAPAILAWMERCPDHYEKTLDEARAALARIEEAE